MEYNILDYYQEKNIKIINININKNIKLDVLDKIEINKDDLKSILSFYNNNNNNNYNNNNYNLKNDLELLEDLEIISNHLVKYFLENININLNYLLDKLELLKNITHYLMIKLKQKEIILINQKPLQRSSYKFCNYKNNCKAKYNKNKNGKCKNDHFSYNKLFFDLSNLSNFLNNNIDISKFHKEIIKCLNTINFVYKHMRDELKSLTLYDKNINIYHF